jgi:diadenosine tetraphosphate (Ap4A) HIT family hydrolase
MRKINTERNKIVYENDFVVVIFSNPRLMPGHLLAAPKRHVEKLSELEMNEQQALFRVVIEFQEKILRYIASGCDIRQNYRPFQKQDGIKVNHLHIHLLPRELYDKLYEECQRFETGIFKKPHPEEFSDLARLLAGGNSVVRDSARLNQN